MEDHAALMDEREALNAALVGAREEIERLKGKIEEIRTDYQKARDEIKSLNNTLAALDAAAHGDVSALANPDEELDQLRAEYDANKGGVALNAKSMAEARKQVLQGDAPL